MKKKELFLDIGRQLALQSQVTLPRAENWTSVPFGSVFCYVLVNLCVNASYGRRSRVYTKCAYIDPSVTCSRTGKLVCKQETSVLVLSVSCSFFLFCERHALYLSLVYLSPHLLRPVLLLHGKAEAMHHWPRTKRGR